MHIHFKIACLLAMQACSMAAPLHVWIGTQSGQPAEAKGIYHAWFDPDSGTLTEPALAVEYKGPGFLALHPTRPILFAVGAPNAAFSDGTSALAAFAVRSPGKLEFLKETSTGGKGACHLALDPTASTVAVANYSDGAISTIRLDEAGLPGKIVSVVRNQGSGPNSSRQEGPHAHGVYFNRSGDRLFVPDLGIDQVLVYPFDAATSRLGPALDPLRTAAGAGPRHLDFSTDERHTYVINELNATLLAARRDGDAWSAIATYPTLPEDFSGQNTTAEVEVSADGRFVYASNRGHDSIVVFARDSASGKLTWLQHAPCGGKTPRHFTLSRCGRWLLCGHLGSQTISVLPRDQQSGKLSAPVHTVSCPAPICLLLQD